MYIKVKRKIVRDLPLLFYLSVLFYFVIFFRNIYLVHPERAFAEYVCILVDQKEVLHFRSG